ncbi:MAG: AsmA family protein [Acidaminococcaceae bacterium]|nr:AsmA family protein [Acidaminococcaceae bacterium]
MMEIKDAKVNLLLEGKPLDFDKVQFQGNFKQYPKIKYGLRVKDGKSDIIADIQNDAGTTAVVAEVKKIPLQNILNVLPQAADVVLTEGNLPDMKIRADKADGKWTLNIDGTIDGLKGSLINYPVTKGSGKFSADTKALKFAGLNLEVAGQTMILEGNVYYAEKPGAKQTYALTVNAPSFAIEALSTGLGLKDAVTALGKVKGTIDKYEAEGTFGLDKLAYDPLYITALSGKFLYKDGKLNIGDAIGNVYAGQVNVNGQVDTRTKDFKLEIQGIDLDSSIVTETQVDDPLSFKMLAIGTADAGSATGAGSFRIGEGKYMMLPFRSIKGSVIRQQGKFAFSNIRIATAVGSFDTNIIVKDNGKLGFDLDKGFLAARLGEK